MDERITRTIETYDLTASQYASTTSDMIDKIQRKLNQFLSYLPSNSDILDLGCAQGRDTAYFASKGHRVVGVDLSSELLNLARSNNANSTVEFIHADLRDKLFVTRKFDGVWACASLLHVPREDIFKTFNNISDYLQEGGALYFSLQEGVGEETRVSKRYGEGHGEKFWTFYEENELRGILDETQFEVLDFVRGDAFKPGAQPWIDFLAKKKTK